jgi:hypothetical protein
MEKLKAKNNPAQRYAVAAASILVLIVAAFSGSFAKMPDFLSFYAGARLAGTPHLYSLEHAYAIQKQITGLEQVRPYIRPPFYAAMTWPIGRLPYSAAFLAWRFLNVAALVGFVMLWRPAVLSLVIACWFPPLWWNLVMGQDIPLILLCLAAAVRLYEKGHPLLAGLVCALCGAKFHMFLLAPLAILAKRAWTFGAGLAMGAVILFGLSAAVAGWDWVARDFEVVKMVDQLDAPQGFMPNLRDSAAVSVGSWVLTAAVALAVLAMTALASLRGSFRYAMAVAVCGSLILSVHAFVYDWVLLLPLLLCIAEKIEAGKAMALSALAGLAGLAVRFEATAWFGQSFPFLLTAVALYLARRPSLESPPEERLVLSSKGVPG